MSSKAPPGYLRVDYGPSDLTVDRASQRLFDLEQVRYRGMPVMDVHQPGYVYALHRRHRDTLRHQRGTVGRSSASGMLIMMEHSGTHVDALCHQAEDLCVYGAGTVDELEASDGFRGGDASSIPTFFHRAVLLDVARHQRRDVLDDGELITAAALADCAAAQGTTIPRSGIVLVRTGNGARWNDPDAYLAGPGIAADASEWLASQQVVAVGADNVAWDVPGYVDDKWQCDLPGHLVLLVRSGIFIIENLALEEIAAADVHEFTFVATPLKLTGATGSPIRPIAITTFPGRT